MPVWAYCATNPPVDANGTASLLRSHQAIWFPPNLNSAHPASGDFVRLVFRDAATGQLQLLGHGFVLPRPKAADTLWSEAQYPGVRAAAQNLGYGGPTNMAFLRLDCVTVYLPNAYPMFHSMTPINPGLNPLPY
jgi:hypothetical protein